MNVPVSRNIDHDLRAVCKTLGQDEQILAPALLESVLHDACGLLQGAAIDDMQKERQDLWLADLP